MIEIIEGLPDGVFGVQATGKLTAEDYEQVLIPAAEEIFKDGEKVSALIILGPDFKGVTAGAFVDDVKLGMGHVFDWKRVALVTDRAMYRDMVKAMGFLFPGEMKVYDPGEVDAAKAWLSS